MDLPSPSLAQARREGRLLFVTSWSRGYVAVIGVNGFFSEVMVENALRCGAEVIRVDADWGQAIEP